jgi:hypothetical protein
MKSLPDAQVQCSDNPPGLLHQFHGVLLANVCLGVSDACKNCDLKRAWWENIINIIP